MWEVTFVKPPITLPYNSHHVQLFFKGGCMESLFSKTIKAGDRTYFVDVKEAKNKSKYLTITESKRKKDAKEGEKKFTQTKVMVFDNDAPKFRDALDEAMKILVK